MNILQAGGLTPVCYSCCQAMLSLQLLLEFGVGRVLCWWQVWDVMLV